MIPLPAIRTADAEADASHPAQGTRHGVDAPPSPRVVTAWTALVCSVDDARRWRALHAAESAGWRVLGSETVAGALQLLERWRTQLAIVDLSATDERVKETLRLLAERIAEHREASQGCLLMIVDDDTTGASELWARQIGAWLYLPEATLDEGITLLCDQALDVAHKLAQHGLAQHNVAIARAGSAL
jgi:hypothetical protein